MAKSKNHLIPLFDLVEPKKFPTQVLSDLNNKDPLGSFICSLAMVYNDIKDLIYFNQILINAFEENKQASYYQIGQASGMNWFINKNYIGVIHEFLDLLKKKEEVVNSSEFKSLLKRLTKNKDTTRECVQLWNNLVHFACGKIDTFDSNKKLTAILSQIRNNISFHYNQTNEMIPAYKYHLHKHKDNINSNHLYASLGNDMEQTRFYFSDAITKGYIEKKFQETNINFDIFIKNFLKPINKSLRFIIGKYLQKRTEQLRIKKNNSGQQL